MTATFVPLKSHNLLVDGLLSGTAWAVNTVTYGFPTQKSDYSYNKEPSHGFRATSAAQQQAVRSTLDMADGNSANDGFSVEGFTDLNFSQSSGSTAIIAVAESTSANPTAYAYTPSTMKVGGDVWYGESYNYRNPQYGNYSMMTTIHELGHALGLKHGHVTDGGFHALPRAYDSLEFSVMTYRTYIGGTTTNVTYGPTSAPQSFMMADIAALQYMYGADYTTNNTNTVYSWQPGTGRTFVNSAAAITPTGNTIFATIWDGGGIDTYDLSAYSSKLTISLAAGGFSSFSRTQLADLGGGPNNGHARGNIFNALLFQGNLASLIENAIGGTGNDTIVGNVVNNALTGGAGMDKLDGKAGNDTLTGDGGADRFIFRLHGDHDIVTDYVDGTDHIFLTGFGLANQAAALSLAADDGFGNVVFTFGNGDILTLTGIAKSVLDASDIFLS